MKTFIMLRKEKVQQSKYFLVYEAFMPFEISLRNGVRTSYATVGEHGSCHSDYIRDHTVPATQKECKRLLNILKYHFHYDIRVIPISKHKKVLDYLQKKGV